MSVPEGQVLEAVLCVLDANPRPNVLFGAPAIPIALLERQLKVPTGHINPQQVIALIEPLLTSLFDTPREARHRCLARSGKDEHWVVFQKRGEAPRKAAPYHSSASPRINPAVSNKRERQTSHSYQSSQDRDTSVRRHAQHDRKNDPSAAVHRSEPAQRPLRSQDGIRVDPAPSIDPAVSRNPSFLRSLSLRSKSHKVDPSPPQDAHKDPISHTSPAHDDRAIAKTTRGPGASESHQESVVDPAQIPIPPTSSLRTADKPDPLLPSSKANKSVRIRNTLEYSPIALHSPTSIPPKPNLKDASDLSTSHPPPVPPAAIGRDKRRPTPTNRPRQRSFDSPPSAPPPITLQLVDTRQSDDRHVPSTALPRNEKEKKRGFLRGLIRRRKGAHVLGGPEKHEDDRTNLKPDGEVFRISQPSPNVKQINKDSSRIQRTTPGALPDHRLQTSHVQTNAIASLDVYTPNTSDRESISGSDHLINTHGVYDEPRQTQPPSELRKNLDAYRQKEEEKASAVQVESKRNARAAVGTGPKSGLSERQIENDGFVATIRLSGYPSPPSRPASDHPESRPGISVDADDKVDPEPTAPSTSVSTTESVGELDTDTESVSDLETPSPIESAPISPAPATTFLGKTFEDLPFGPDVPAFLLVDWIGDRWKVLLVELLVILGLAYVVQAAGL